MNWKRYKHWSYFRGKSHFKEDGTQNYLVFQPINKYFKKISNSDHISEWKSKRLSDEVIKPPTTTSDNSLARALNYVGNKIRVQFDGDCLKQDKITYTHGTIVNTYIIYELISPLKYFDLTLENCLFGAVKSTKNADIDKYKNSG